MVAKTIVTEEGTGPTLFRPLTLSTIYTLIILGAAAAFPHSIGEWSIDVGISTVIIVNAVALVCLCATTVRGCTEALGIPFFNVNVKQQRVESKGEAAGSRHATDKAHAS